MAACAAYVAIDSVPGAAVLLPLPLAIGGSRVCGGINCPRVISCSLLAAFSALLGLPRFFLGGSVG